MGWGFNAGQKQRHVRDGHKGQCGDTDHEAVSKPFNLKQQDEISERTAQRKKCK